MATKIQAAKIAMQSGAAMVIANGDRPNVLRELLGGKRVGTLFLPQRRPLEMRKRWIAFFQTPQGELVIDDGACLAILEKGKPASHSVVEVRSFDVGELVSVVDGGEESPGLSEPSSRHIERMKAAAMRSRRTSVTSFTTTR